MPTAIESITNYLTARRESHNGPDLIDLHLKYGCDLETQVNVAADAGEPVAGKRSTYTDGINTWFSFRIPKDADTAPWFRDFPMKFPLDPHVDGIGSTGWDWKAKRSRYVGYDYDSIVGHAAGIGVTDKELEKVVEAAKALPYVTVRKSTGGGGLHLYVLFENDPAFDTNTHTEHAALARYVLSVMSKDAGFSFHSTVDACGGNMWLWHRKSAGTEGLTLVKQGELFLASQLTGAWRDHVPVIERQRAKVRINNMPSDEEDIFEQLASAHRQVMPDAKHRAMMAAISKMGIACHWVEDHHLLQTHTVGFKRLIEQRTLTYVTPDGQEESFELLGVFDTVSKGSDLQTPNCFAFPIDNGAWKIYRFGSGGRITEAEGWEQDTQGRTTAWFNVRPNLDMAARFSGGKKLKRGGYEFDAVERAVEVIKLLKPNFEMNIEEHLKKRKAVIERSKDGNVVLEIPKDKADDTLMRDKGKWNDSDKKNYWTQVFDIAAQPEKLDVSDYDNLIRCLETRDGQPAGWALRKPDQKWTRKQMAEIKIILQHRGHPKPEAEQIMGCYAENPWTLVTEPFQPEYPRGRCWNLNAPQYRFTPAPRLANASDDEGEISRHPHWDMVLNHIGSDLTKYLADLEWAITYGIRTGGDYLRAIFAVILREPREKTPYLFLFGPENSGKSIVHEAFELLVTDGVVMADRALTSQSDFNGELEGAILCVVEEKNISKTPGALAKIKAAVTSPRLSIRKMRQNSYMVENLTHWIQVANEQDACPIFDGDTRITMVYVPELDRGEEIPKSLLLQKLRDEGPAFMRTLLDITLPPVTGRLRIPIVNTQHKEYSAQRNRNSLEAFIAEQVYQVPGQLIAYSEFYDRFVTWLPPEEKGFWSRAKMTKSLPPNFQSGVGNGNKTYIINASWEPAKSGDDARPYYVINNRVKREGTTE